MRYSVLRVAPWLAGALVLPRAVAAQGSADTISSLEAARHIGETASVRGIVAVVFTSRNQNIFLNFDRPYPHQSIQGVIFRRSAAAFADPRQYEGREAVITGQIRLYNGKPEIILDSPAQIHVVGEAASAGLALTDSGPTSPVRQTRPCLVTLILDGDTIHCARLGDVRLIGIDAPEGDQRPFGDAARDALAALVALRDTVHLELDVESRDRFDRWLAYVWNGSGLVNWTLVRRGWAVQLTYPPNVQYVDWFTTAERRAREERRGLWAKNGFDCRPVDHRGHRCD